MAMDDTKGLIRNKYLVYKTRGDGQPDVDVLRAGKPIARGWHKRTWSFVLSPAKRDEYGAASRAALVAYATTIVKKNPKLATEIREYLRRVDVAIESEAEGRGE